VYGRINIIYNDKAVSSSKPTYNAICVMNELGEYETLLLTENDLKVVRKRAAKNPEDCIHLPALTKALLWVLRSLRLV